jgi:hypothetical protein
MITKFTYWILFQIYGVASTINSANYVYFIALEKVLDLKNPAAGTIEIAFVF